MTWWHSIILGIVEGITEFLPVSSTGHLTIAESLLGYQIDAPTVTAYTAIIQVGAMLAAVIYFWKDIVRIATAFFSGITNPRKRCTDYQMALAIIGGFAVTAVVALLTKPLIEGPLRSLWFVAGGLIIWALVMYCGDRMWPWRGEDSIRLKDGLILGLIQCLSLIPGVSRSGATIVGGLFMGLDRVAATRFSFFLGIPTLVAAGGMQAVSEFSAIGGAGGVGWGATIIGTVVSGVVAYASIAWLLRFVSTNNFTAFVIYRIIIGFVMVGLICAGIMIA
ncbi:MAG: undecaprenyl-diphosphate phosphatase [Actinomycetaceae bacterium]|nr:undecaprenyl-diphosphate phosphatase [Actinomycetaceae bacterium]